MIFLSVTMFVLTLYYIIKATKAKELKLDLYYLIAAMIAALISIIFLPQTIVWVAKQVNEIKNVEARNLQDNISRN